MSNIVSELGGPTAVARMCGIRVPSVIGWKGRPPVERCPAIERETKGAWTCERLRPDVKWVRVPDMQWPHPGGKPLLDVDA